MSAARLPPVFVLVAAGLVLALVPAFKLPAFYESFLYLVFFWISLATSWNILSGYAGYFRDPDGHFWEIAFNPGFDLNEAGELTLPDFGTATQPRRSQLIECLRPIGVLAATPGWPVTLG